jgi:hypothetical protein
VLHQHAAKKILVMKTVGAAISMALFVAIASPSDAMLKPVAGIGCDGSSQFLQQNLPLGPMKSVGEGKFDTDIVDIGVFGPRSFPIAGWLYTNRRGDLIIEVRKGDNEYAAEALQKAGSPATAKIARQIGFLTFSEVPKDEATGLEVRLREAKEFTRCFTTALK